VDCYAAALTLLSRRELSTRQLRDRLIRRKFSPEEIDPVLAKLTSDGALDDQRVARASARLGAVVKRRGRRRVLQEVRQLGISATTAKEAVDKVFAEVDETALLDRAIERRLRGVDVSTLDQQTRARVVRSLVGQGFDAAQVQARLRVKGARSDE
jgi:regulatory protein